MAISSKPSAALADALNNTLAKSSPANVKDFSGTTAAIAPFCDLPRPSAAHSEGLPSSLAAAVVVSKQTVYKQFTDKEQLSEVDPWVAGRRPAPTDPP